MKGVIDMTTISTTTIESAKRFKDIMNDLKSAGKRALKDIPVELLAIDETYQTIERTGRRDSINRLAANWDENKLEPITVVPHIEECKFYVVNGYGRWQASQMQTPKYEYLCANVLLGVSNMDATERRKFESELYAYQNREVAQLKPIQKHGAFKNLEIPEVLLLEELKEKYDFTFSGTKGQRDKGVIGSYSMVMRIAKGRGKECLSYIFEICRMAGFDRKPNGYSSYIIGALRDIWAIYPDSREETKSFLSQYLRSYDPAQVKAEAQVKYPILDYRIACSMLLEDITVDNLSLNKCRTIDNGKIVKLA